MRAASIPMPDRLEQFCRSSKPSLSGLFKDYRYFFFKRFDKQKRTKGCRQFSFVFFSTTVCSVANGKISQESGFDGPKEKAYIRYPDPQYGRLAFVMSLFKGIVS
jgi:hypothetical protein